MQQARYKVETFIVPEGNRCRTGIVANEEDDTKIANKLRRSDEYIRILNAEDSQSSDIGGERETRIAQLKYRAMLKDGQEVCALNNIIVSKTQMRRFNSLTSIDEALEDTDDKCNNLCCHGYENGCTVPAQSPERISEEIFRENWLNRLEILRNREAALNDKEIALQCRERSLFQREKELRILERQLTDKLKQVEQYSKRIERSQSVNNKQTARVIESRSSSESSGSHGKNTVCSVNSKSSSELSRSQNRSIASSTNSKSSIELKSFEKTASNVYEHIQQKVASHNIIQEKCFEGEKVSNGEAKQNEQQTLSVNNVSTKQIGKKHFSRPSSTPVSTVDKFQSTGFFRVRQRSAIISYDDLDSTLSADIGDASFVQTSKKFNPEDYKKPFAFTRSASERRPKHMSNKDSSSTAAQTVSTLKEKPLTLSGTEESKILKRISDNISVSDDGSTMFQDYGLIDQQTAESEKQCKSNTLCDEKRYSYLNLELEQCSTQYKKAKASKERPVSWSEETNEWLQKKRQAYNNLMTKRIIADDSNNKENLRCSVKTNVADKPSKKMDVKRKMFTIFR